MSAEDLVRDLFAGLGEVRVRRMFGGAGVYVDGMMFGLIADDVIHIKADASLATELAAEGSGPFVWVPPSGPREGQEIAMSYWRLPDAAFDDPDIACAWGRRALAVARTAAKPKKARPRRA